MIKKSILEKKENIKSKNRKKNDNEIIIKNPFESFNSVLFLSNYQDISNNEEKLSLQEKAAFTSDTSIEAIDREENIETNSNFILRLSPSYEKCLSNELLESLIKDSEKSKSKELIHDLKNDVKEQQKNNNFHKRNPITKDSPIISRKNGKEYKNKFNINFISTKDNEYINNINIENNNIKKKNEENNIYEETINGFQYQLKFIENSLNNILPKSYNNKSFIFSSNSFVDSANKSSRYTQTKKIKGKISPFVLKNKKFNNNNNFNDNFSCQSNSYFFSHYSNDFNNNYLELSKKYQINNYNNSSFPQTNILRPKYGLSDNSVHVWLNKRRCYPKYCNIKTSLLG